MAKCDCYSAIFDSFFLHMKQRQWRYLGMLACALIVAGTVFFMSSGTAAMPRRPQTPSLPLPYAVEQVAFGNAGSRIRLSGTLTLPPGPGPHPAIVLVPGSGPVDRDGSVLGHQFYLVLADHLTRQGFAVLRSDKRGLGKSGGDFAAATTFDFASDIEAALAFLRSRPGIDTRRIGLAGHSEGGLVGAIVAVRDPALSFLVLMAGNGVPMRDIIAERLASLATGGPAGAARERALQHAVFAAAQAPAGDSERAAALRKLFLAAQQEYGRTFSEEEYAMYLTPWMRTLLSIDPHALLRQVRCPVLALVGEKDQVVTADLNVPALQRALAANPRAEVHRLPALNHFFQTAVRGDIEEVAGIEETMSPHALGLIGDWSLRQVQASTGPAMQR